MQNPFSLLLTLQIEAVNRSLALTRNVLDFYLSLQPKLLQPVRISNSTSLVPINQPTQHRAR